MGHRTTEELPRTADIVIIGSGITGTFAAQELVTAGKSVVMLDAREACWGATGRNGGHCQPAVWDSTREAARFELDTFDMINRLVTKHNIPCDWHIVGGVHSIYSTIILETVNKQINLLQQEPDLSDKAILILDKSKLARMNIPEAIAAVYQPSAAKFWPYKLVSWMLQRLLIEYDPPAFNLQTNTPVERLERHRSSWIVQTPRGQLSAREVLLACNAYTSHLLPNMTGLITPVRGQLCALEPPAGATQLSHSYVWIKDADYQYLVHRGPEDTSVENGSETAQSEDGLLIFGGERLAVPGGEEGVSCDGSIDPIISQALRRGLIDAINLRSANEPEREALHAAYEWTGIMGYSQDGSPWVGRVPNSLLSDGDTQGDSDGLWVSAGYTGHGMPVAPGCGIAVANMIMGKDGGIVVPKQWAMSEERVERARKMKLPQTNEDLVGILCAS